MALSEAMAVFAGILLLSFGLTILLSGFFTSYFGAGKSRKIGVGLVIVGLLALFAWTTITFGIELFTTVEAWTAEQMGLGVSAVLAGMLGGMIGLALFLVAIMRA